MKEIASQRKIEERLDEMGRQLSLRILSRDITNPPIYVCVLRGGFMFFSDMVKRLPAIAELDFIRIASYHDAKQGEIQLKVPHSLDPKGKDIYLFDDIRDTGGTTRYLEKYYTDLGAKSVVSIVAAERKSNTSKAFMSGFSVDDEWLLGYGMDDHRGLLRNVNAIWGTRKPSR